MVPSRKNRGWAHYSDPLLIKVWVNQTHLHNNVILMDYLYIYHIGPMNWVNIKNFYFAHTVWTPFGIKSQKRDHSVIMSKWAKALVRYLMKSLASTSQCHGRNKTVGTFNKWSCVPIFIICFCAFWSCSFRITQYSQLSPNGQRIILDTLAKHKDLSKVSKWGRWIIKYVRRREWELVIIRVGCWKVWKVSRSFVFRKMVGQRLSSTPPNWVQLKSITPPAQLD